MDTQARSDVEFIVRNGPSIDAIWPSVSEQLARVKSDDLDLFETYTLLKNREAILFLVYVGGEFRAACVAMLEIGLQKRTLSVVMMSGYDMHEWLGEAIELIEDYAHEVGAEEISCMARPGLAKKLRNFDWKYSSQKMVLPLNGVRYGRAELETENTITST